MSCIVRAAWLHSREALSANGTLALQALADGTHTGSFLTCT